MIIVGSVAVDVVPDASRFWTEFKAKTAGQAGGVGEDIGRQIGDRVADKVARGVKDGVDKGGRDAAAKGAKAGEDYGGKFADTTKRRIEAALKNLPTPQIGVATTEAEQKLKDLHSELATLGTKRVGIDIDEATALAEVDRLRAEFERLGAEHPSVQVRVDSAAAAAELARVTAEARAVDRLDPTVTVHADTDQAASSIKGVGSSSLDAGGAMGVLSSVGAALSPAIVPAAAEAAAAVAAIGSAALVGVSGIAVLALAITPVVAALQAADKAQGAAGSSAASAASRQVALANAADQVRNAEVALTNAQQNALRAQQALAQARLDEARAQQDLNLQVADGALAQRQANLDVAKAKQELDAALANPAATQLQRQQARLTYDQAVQQVTDLGVRQQRLVEQQQINTRTGVEGSQRVQNAQHGVVQAQQQVEQSTRALAAAHRAQGQAATQAASGGAAAVNQFAAAMAALSPAGREFVRFIQSLKPEFTALQRAAETGLLPGVEAGLRALLPVMPAIRAFVSQVAVAFGNLFATLGRALASPFWSTFFAQIAAAAGPLLQSFATIVLNLGQAFATLLVAFLPLSQQMGAGLANLAVKFATFITTWTQSQGFTAFIDYVTRNAPVLLRLLGDLVVVVLKLAIALAPLGELALKGLGALADWLAKLTPGQLIAVAAGVGAVVAAIVLIVGGPVTAVVAGITAIVAALVWAYTHFQRFRDIVDTVARAWWAFATTMAQVYLGLWNAIVAATTGIVSAITTAWGIIRPVFNALVFLISNFTIPAVLALWHGVVEPAFQGIALAVSIAWAAIQIVFGLFQIGLKILGGAFRNLYEAYIRPAWDAIRPLFVALGTLLRDYVAPVFQSGVTAISRAWDGLREAARVPVAFVVNHVVNPLIRGYNNLADAFKVGKVAEIPGFAFGGFVSGPGGPRDDAILARLSAGEYVIPADVVRAWGVDFFNALVGRDGKRPAQAGDGSFGVGLPGFADGGLVGWIKQGWDAFTHPTEIIKAPAEAALKLIPGGGLFRDVVAGMGHRLIDGLLSWIGTGGGKGDVGKTQAWLHAQAGKPYVWAAAGPNGYDCCIVAGVRVYGPDGAKPIQDVRAGDRVYSYVDGQLEPHTVTAAWQSIHQPVFAVRTRNRTITASANHPFLRVVRVGEEQVEHREDANWPGLPDRYRNAAECNVSTCVKPVRANGLCGMHRERWRKHGDPRITLSRAGQRREDAEWPGVPVNHSYGARKGAECSVSTCAKPVCANGMCGAHQARWRKYGDPRITVTTRSRFEAQWARLDELQPGDLLVQPREMPCEPKPHPVLADGTTVDADVAWLIGAMVGDGTVTDKGVRLCLYGDARDRATEIITARWGGKPTHGKTFGLVVSKKRLAVSLAALGMRCLGPDKRVPEAVWTWAPELQRAFLDGYCDADGHRPADQKRHGERTYASASRELIEDVRALHMMLGDPVSNIHVTERTKPITIQGKLVKNPRAQHSVAVWPDSGRGEAKLRNQPGLAAWLDAGDFTLGPVLAIQPKGEQDTWDLEVEAAHNFVADGVVVHNSGLVSAAWNMMHGKNPYSHTFVTSTQDPYFPLRGHGLFTAGWAWPGEKGGGRVGHTAGNLAGLGFESAGGVGVRVGPSATSVDSFARVGHYDSGGYLMPGLTLAYNGTGQPEAVLTGDQIRSLSAAGDAKAPSSIHVYVGDRELRDLVRVEVRDATGGIARSVTSGVRQP